MRAASQFKAALPKASPGCWKRAGFLRRYKRAWASAKRKNDAFRIEELKRQKVYRDKRDAKKKKRNAKKVRQWKVTHAPRVRRHNRRWHALNRVRRCHFCGKRGKSGRGALKGIVREFPDASQGGRIVKRTVDYCGSC